ncbi:MAG: DUF5667 domain-containing protein [Minisyncoccia bacterium]
MIGLFIVLALALGVGGTAVVSDDARPGDALFGLDRAVENARLSFTSEENKNELRVRFAEERLKEVKELEVEDNDVSDETDEVLDDGDAKDEDVKMGIEYALDLLTDIDEGGEVEDARLATLAAELSAYLDKLPADARVEVSDDKLRIKFDQGPEKIEIKDQGENKSKIEVRTEEGRMRIEVKNGEIEIKTKTEDSGSWDSLKKGIEEAEAKILSDKTIVEVEVNDEKTTFATSANTKEGIIAAILVKFPTLTAEKIGAVLKIETEDDEDKVEDSDDDSDIEDDSGDDSDADDDSGKDDSSDDDSDDNDDDSGSNSGSGSR